MDKKRIIYAILFVIVVLGVGGLIIFFNNATENRDKIANIPTNLGNKTTTESTKNNAISNITSNNTTLVAKEKVAATISKLNDGTMYQTGDLIEKADIVIGDNLFDTQLADINLNFPQYEGKTIEIEGMYMENTPYTFVGRYSNSNLCAYCPQGYSYFEYEWNGDKTPYLADEITWLKIKGTLTRGEDDYGEYYYIAANSLEVMNERGIDTVNN